MTTKLIERLEYKWRGLVPETLEQRALQRLRKLEAVIDKALDEDYISNQWLQEALAACGDES